MAVTEPAIGSGNWGPVVNAALTQLDTIGASAGYHAQTLASNGAVTIDASTGQVQKVLLQANATSTSITNAATGQRLTIAWAQDGTGSRTYTWPANCKFAGGTAPVASTAANYMDRVQFEYDGTNWNEISRALAVR